VSELINFAGARIPATPRFSRPVTAPL